MRILGIESSCDDTALALVEESTINSPSILGSVMASQVPVHALFGGVVPELASREHARLIAPLLDKLLHDSNVTLAQIDGIAVTRGPGLLGSLLVGVAFAKTLAFAAKKPLIGINHLHAHLLVAGLENKLEFPALGVLVSGGHTHLIQMNSPLDMIILGKTLDDAAGEACDKFGKIIGLPYPGGAHLDKIAQRGEVNKKLFPRPYIKNQNLDFSFSGLKTAGSAWLEESIKNQEKPKLALLDFGQDYDEAYYDSAPKVTKDAAASYLYAIADTLKIKTERALKIMQEKNCTPKCLVLAGGVAANSFVRSLLNDFALQKKLPLLIPRNTLCADNGVMVAYTGLLLAKNGYSHDLDLNAIPRGKVIPNDYKQ